MFRKQCLVFFLFFGSFFTHIQPVHARPRPVEWLATPQGAAAVAIIYGVGSGIANFVWAFDWKEHAGVSDDTHSDLQEAGGLTASALSFLLGGAVPVMIYIYQTKHTTPPTQAEV